MHDKAISRLFGLIFLLVLIGALPVDVPGAARKSSANKAPSDSDCLLGPKACTAETPLSLRVTTDLVQLPVTVVDKQDRIVENLQKENFSVYENGTEQTIVNFELDSGPVSACLVFDSSGSMASKYHRSVEAIRDLLDAAIPNDEYCLVRFSDWPEVMVGMTNDAARIAATMQRIYPNGWTALLDGIYIGMQEVKRGNNRRKAIVLVSDGGDNRSRHTRREIMHLVKEADAQIYSIGILADEYQINTIQSGMPAPFPPEELEGPALLKTISHQSGGRVYLIHQINELPAAVEKITKAVRQQYILGYYPTGARNGEYRRVVVKLKPPKGLRAYWRAGYFAPGQ